MCLKPSEGNRRILNIFHRKHITPKMTLHMSKRVRKIMLTLKTPWPESAGELYRPSDRRLLTELAPTFADRRVPRGQRDGSLRSYSRIF
jgi:hypothetical protein